MTITEAGPHKATCTFNSPTLAPWTSKDGMCHKGLAVWSRESTNVPPTTETNTALQPAWNSANSSPTRPTFPYLYIIVTTKIRDRKSTRLNSSHANISYAVFCLKKKNKIQDEIIFTDQLPY